VHPHLLVEYSRDKLYFTGVKKTERILGIVAVSLFLLATFFKMRHWPGAAIMHTVSALLFNLGYLPLQLIRESREADSRLAKFYVIFRFIALFMVMFAFLFKIQHWPGAGILLFLSTYLIPLFILLYFYIRIRGKGAIPFHWNDLFLAVIAYLIHIFVTQSMVSPQVVEGYVILEEQYSKINAGLETANQLIYSSLDSVSDSGDQELIASIKELWTLSSDLKQHNDVLKSDFISSFYTHPLGEEFDLLTADRALLASTVESHIYFLNQGRGKELKSTIENYLQAIAQIHQRHHLPASLIATGFDLEDFTDQWGLTQTWEEHMFERMPIASVITTLSWIEQVVLLVERGTLNQLSILLNDEEGIRVLQELATSESKLAIELKENEILRIRQQRELQRIQLDQSRAELAQRNTVTALAFAGIVFVLILLTISTRAYLLKQKDNKLLAQQKEEIAGKNEALYQRNEEILAQRDEIEAQRDEIEAQRDLVTRQKEEIEKTHHEISASIDYAMRLQDAMLPGTELLKDHFSDHLVLFRPKQKVSGDFYWWAQLGNAVVIAVADCTGHGVPGAFMSMLGASLLKEVVKKEGITRPGTILDRIREEVIVALNQTGAMGEQKDGMDLALVTIHTDRLKCEFAGANNPLYLVRQGQLKEYKGELMPLSHYQRMDPFSTREIELEKEDQLYLSSDGYADQFGGEHRKKFKYKAFQQLIAKYSGASMQEQNKVLLDTILKWQGTHEQIDDMVVVGIKI
jgi:serine phosphatase RsbU (regulator of sigma subunit)